MSMEKEGEEGRNPMHSHTKIQIRIHTHAHHHCVTCGCKHPVNRINLNSCQGQYNTETNFRVHVPLYCHLQNNTCTNDTFCTLLISP